MVCCQWYSCRKIYILFYIMSGDFVLAIHDVENLIYLPGRVMAENGDKLVVNFCNKKRSVSKIACLFFYDFFVCSNLWSSTFEPGIFFLLIINLCFRSHHVLPNQCYWISRQYYDLSVAFYNSKQVHQN